MLGSLQSVGFVCLDEGFLMVCASGDPEALDPAVLVNLFSLSCLLVAPVLVVFVHMLTACPEDIVIGYSSPLRHRVVRGVGRGW